MQLKLFSVLVLAVLLGAALRGSPLVTPRADVRASGSVEVPLRAGAFECPDPELRALVMRLEEAADGSPVWVLEDGRRLQRNPRSGDGEPLLVPAR